MKFYSFHLDPDPITLVPKLDLDIVKVYVGDQIEVAGSSGSKVTARKHRQTDRQTRLKLIPNYIQGHSRKKRLSAVSAPI